MNLFRSEEHVTRWLADRAPGVTIPMMTLEALALAWWGDRLDPAWTPRTREHNQAILARLGLTGAFWRLPG
jgi:hypothetical protein